MFVLTNYYQSNVIPYDVILILKIAFAIYCMNLYGHANKARCCCWRQVVVVCAYLVTLVIFSQ